MRRGNVQYTKNRHRDHSQRDSSLLWTKESEKEEEEEEEGRNIECQTVCSEFQEKEAPLPEMV